MNGLPANNIRWVVLSVINRLELPDNQEYERLEQFAFEGWHEFGLKAMPSIQVHRETIGSTGVVHFPQDYVRHTKIGVCINNRVYTLTLNDDICKDKPQVCGSISESASQEIGYSFVSHYHNGAHVTALYTQGGGINKRGYYSIDHTRRRIILEDLRLSGRELIVEYQSSGKASAQTLVPPLYIEALRYWITWKYYEYKNPNLAAREQNQYELKITEAKYHQNAFTSDELLDLLYATSAHKIR